MLRVFHSQLIFLPMTFWAKRHTSTDRSWRQTAIVLHHALVFLCCQPFFPHKKRFNTTIRKNMKVVVALVAALGCAEAWSGAPNTRITARAPTAKQAIAIPLEQAEQTVEVDEDNAWVANLDYEGFTKEVNDLGKQLLEETGEADVVHLEKILRWRDIAAAVGVATMWMTPNPLTVAALSTWTYASWTMVAHHTCHGGTYNGNMCFCVCFTYRLTHMILHSLFYHRLQ
jgi:hypothetical protein